MIGFVDQTCMGQGTLALGAHLCQDVAFVRVLPLDFSRAGVREPLLGAGVGFHLWHVTGIFKGRQR